MSYVGLSKIDPTGHSPEEEADGEEAEEEDCPCTVYDSKDVRATQVQLQAFRARNDPDAGAEAMINILHLEIAQKILNIINLTGAGVANSLDDAIREIIDAGLLPSAQNTAEGIRNIWENVNSGVLNRRRQVMWIKVEGECCREARFPSLFDPYYDDYQDWYRCGAAGMIDATDPRNTLQKIVDNLESCKAKAKQAFDCKSLMGSRKG